LNVMPARLFFCRHLTDRAGQERNGQRANGSGRSMSLQPAALEPTGPAKPPLSSG
jgi:hypothetical protein